MTLSVNHICPKRQVRRRIACPEALMTLCAHAEAPKQSSLALSIIFLAFMVSTNFTATLNSRCFPFRRCISNRTGDRLTVLVTQNDRLLLLLSLLRMLRSSNMNHCLGASMCWCSLDGWWLMYGRCANCMRSFWLALFRIDCNISLRLKTFHAWLTYRSQMQRALVNFQLTWKCSLRLRRRGRNRRK